MMPITRVRRPSAAPAVVDLLLAIVVALMLVVATLRGESPPTGLATSANFTIWADSQPQAEALLARAEVWRRRIAAEWLGEPLPDGVGRASLNVKLSDRDRAHAWLAGASSGDGHLVWIHTTREKLDHALAHEVAHVVLATRWPGLPPFAHEGIAGRYDDDARVAIRRRMLSAFVRTGRWPHLGDVLRARSIPPSDQASYAAAVSFAEFLLSEAFERHGPTAGTSRAAASGQQSAPLEATAASSFLAFASEVHRNGRWEEALAHRCGFTGIGEVEQAWRQWAADSLHPNGR